MDRENKQDIADFQGFSQETIDFFISLRKNNTKAWFEKHRQDYELYVLEPAKSFVLALGVKLKKISPEIVAVPKVNRSLFRINRDTRFSPDKSPYKTYMGIFFWEGKRPRMECSGFYFHLEPPNMMLGVGIYIFPKIFMERYRNAVVHPEYGAELSAIIEKISRMEGFELGGRHYKRIPQGYDSGHPNADLLLYNGLYAGLEIPVPNEFFSPKLVEFCWNVYHPLASLHRWLVALYA